MTILFNLRSLSLMPKKKSYSNMSIEELISSRSKLSKEIGEIDSLLSRAANALPSPPSSAPSSNPLSSSNLQALSNLQDRTLPSPPSSKPPQPVPLSSKDDIIPISSTIDDDKLRKMAELSENNTTSYPGELIDEELKRNINEAKETLSKFL